MGMNQIPRLDADSETQIMITEAELTSLLELIDSLEATAASQAAQIDFLMRERVFFTEGPDALLNRFGRHSVEQHHGEIPPGYGIGNAGQLIRIAAP